MNKTTRSGRVCHAVKSRVGSHQLRPRRNQKSRQKSLNASHFDPFSCTASLPIAIQSSEIITRPRQAQPTYSFSSGNNKCARTKRVTPINLLCKSKWVGVFFCLCPIFFRLTAAISMPLICMRSCRLVFFYCLHAEIERYSRASISF